MGWMWGDMVSVEVVLTRWCRQWAGDGFGGEDGFEGVGCGGCVAAVCGGRRFRRNSRRRKWRRQKVHQKLSSTIVELTFVMTNSRESWKSMELPIDYLQHTTHKKVAYENSLIYKGRTKKLHDDKIKNRIFNVGDQVLLFNSRLKIFSGKLKSCWSGPFTIAEIYPYGTAKLIHPDGCNFKVNYHRLKQYHGGDLSPLEIPDVTTFLKDN
nr:reverse transcriptase domain-containing protein [Tanacetum cinerariifolium]